MPSYSKILYSVNERTTSATHAIYTPSFPCTVGNIKICGTWTENDQNGFGHVDWAILLLPGASSYTYFPPSGTGGSWLSPTYNTLMWGVGGVFRESGNDNYREQYHVNEYSSTWRPLSTDDKLIFHWDADWATNCVVGFQFDIIC